MVEKYSFKANGDNMIAPHFAVKEFASINGSKLYSDDVLIDTKITEILEKLYQKLGCYKMIITSGYRTPEHEKAVGNKSGKGYHTTGQAVDINAWKNKTDRYTSKEICLALEDLEWNHGIGIITNTAVHIDSRSNKYWFDENNANKSIGNSFYTYYYIMKEKSDVELAIDKLVKKGIIDSGDYWKDKTARVTNISQFNNNVDTLIIKLASNI